MVQEICGRSSVTGSTQILQSPCTAGISIRSARTPIRVRPRPTCLSVLIDSVSIAIPPTRPYNAKPAARVYALARPPSHAISAIPTVPGITPLPLADRGGGQDGMVPAPTQARICSSSRPPPSSSYHRGMRTRPATSPVAYTTERHCTALHNPTQASSRTAAPTQPARTHWANTLRCRGERRGFRPTALPQLRSHQPPEVIRTTQTSPSRQHSRHSKTKNSPVRRFAAPIPSAHSYHYPHNPCL